MSSRLVRIRTTPRSGGMPVNHLRDRPREQTKRRPGARIDVDIGRLVVGRTLTAARSKRAIGTCVDLMGIGIGLLPTRFGEGLRPRHAAPRRTGDGARGMLSRIGVGSLARDIREG